MTDKYVANPAKGVVVITKHNANILAALKLQGDACSARLELDRKASLEAVKLRHKNELKAMKRNFKHRGKRINDAVQKYVDMKPVELGDMFRNGVPPKKIEIEIDVSFSGRWSGGGPNLQLHHRRLVELDVAELEKKILMTPIVPILR